MKTKPRATARFHVVMTPALHAACSKAAERAGIPLSTWLRRVTAKAAGRPEFAETLPRGKPKGVNGKRLTAKS